MASSDAKRDSGIIILWTAKEASGTPAKRPDSKGPDTKGAASKGQEEEGLAMKGPVLRYTKGPEYKMSGVLKTCMRALLIGSGRGGWGVKRSYGVATEDAGCNELEP